MEAKGKDDYRQWQIEREGLRPGDYTISPDDDYVLITADRIIILHRENETMEEYGKRADAARPPLTVKQRQRIRAAADEYWDTVHRRERRA
jgi:hypothetical protein